MQSRAGAALGELQPVGNAHRIGSGRTASRGRGRVEQGQSDRGGEADTKCYGLTTTGAHCSPALLEGKTKKRWMGGSFLLASSSQCCIELLTGNKLR